MSPHQRDVVRRRVGAFTYEEKPGLILEDVLESMYSDFERKHPNLVKLSAWKLILRRVAWNIKKVNRVGS